MIHRWPELATVAKRDRAAARILLRQRLAPIHDGGNVRVTIVFDGRGPELALEHPTGEPSYSVIYTPAGTTADDVIEQMVANSAQPSQCCVATEDNAERETIRAAGAIAMDAQGLADWCERSRGDQERAAAHLRAENAKAWKRPQ